MSDNAIKVLLAVIGLFAAGFVLKFIFKSDKSSNRSNQIGNSVKGDQAGRDINKS